MLVIAHRGANREALENSWQAFHKAVDAGSERIEVDLQMTRDGEIVIMHDDDTAHTCPVAKTISKLSAAELRQIHLRNGEEIPTLQKLMHDFLPKVELNLEIKGDRLDLTARAAQMIATSGFADKVIFSCFHPGPLVYLAEHYPTLQRAVLWGYDTWSIAPHFFLAPQLMMEHCQSHIFHPQVDLVSRHLSEFCLGRNWLIYPWVPMRGEASQCHRLWQHLLDTGVHGLCTNAPRQLRAFLATRQGVST